jgi:hypothetical protein
MVSDPDRVEALFREQNVPFGVCSMIVVELREVATELAKLLAALLMAEVNVHFCYPLLTLHVDLQRWLCMWKTPIVRFRF